MLVLMQAGVRRPAAIQASAARRIREERRDWTPVTNEAILTILEHLCNEARNSAHATFGVIELLRDAAMDSVPQSCVAIGTAGADQLLRCLDDVRDLLSSAAPASSTVEEFDLVLCAGEIAEVLNLASGNLATGGKSMVLDAPHEPVLVTQDRRAVEQMLTRVLNLAFNLAKTGETHLQISPRPGENGMRVMVTPGDVDLAARLGRWLNADPEQVVLEDSNDVPFGVAGMVAGKRLRALGGFAELVHDSEGQPAVTLDLPSQARMSDRQEPAGSPAETRSDRLNILVTEDCDDSFALSELLLQSENVWRARDGWDALRIIQRQRFDVVFMDAHMPGMDGYSAIRNVREWETQTGNARTPMVMMSSDDVETQRRFAAECGCSGFLRKPVRRNDLIRLLHRLRETRMLVA
jgi:CheY-like chemotaxis protein